jgi:hypothetical protein
MLDSSTKEKAETDRKKLLNRLRVLNDIIARTTTSEAERQAALGRMKVLRDKFNVTEAELDHKASGFNVEEENFPLIKPRINKWFCMLLVTVAELYDCHGIICSYTRDDGESEARILKVMGDEIDIACIVSVMDYLIPQAVLMADKLYEWACNVKDPEKSKAMNLDIEQQYTTFNYAGVSYTGFAGFAFPKEALMREVLNKYDVMPNQFSREWSDLEEDWGHGFNQMVITRLMAIMEKGNTSTSENDEDLIKLNASQRSPNQLVVSNRSLMVLEEQKTKKRQAVTSYAQENYSGAKKTKANPEIKHAFLYKEGNKTGKDVTIDEEATPGKTTKKKNKDGR